MSVEGGARPRSAFCVVLGNEKGGSGKSTVAMHVAVAEESHWIPLTDLMTGLMVIFLLIAVSYMMQVEADAARIKNVAVAYSETRDHYTDLTENRALTFRLLFRTLGGTEASANLGAGNS